MEGISDIRIIGIDAKRPPRIRKEPYIDIYFQLSHKVPIDWCQDFITVQTNMEYDVSMNIEDCLHIQTWVRTPNEIPKQLQSIKALVAECNQRYIENIVTSTLDQDSDNDNLNSELGPQGELNRIIAELDFSE